ncbi:MAG: hypothetical protein ACOX3T_03895 [Bdellovibrionota bacterium]
MKRNLYILAIFCLLSLFIVSCTKDKKKSSESQSGSSPNGNLEEVSEEVSEEVKETKCGVPINNGLTKNPSDKFLINATIDDVISAELYVLTPFEGGGSFLVKLPAVKDNKTSASQRNYIYRMIRDSGTFVKVYKAEQDCVVTVKGGGKAYIASIVFENGTVLAEKLLRIDYLEPEDPVCVNSSLVPCYASLKGIDVGKEASKQVVSNFLWKPKADKDGKLVVLLNPYDVSIFVNGEKLENTGPSNGRGTTARGRKPGCEYGKATVKVIENTGKTVKFPDGNLSYTIEDGCKRVEFK